VEFCDSCSIIANYLTSKCVPNIPVGGDCSAASASCVAYATCRYRTAVRGQSIGWRAV